MTARSPAAPRRAGPDPYDQSRSVAWRLRPSTLVPKCLCTPPWVRSSRMIRIVLSGDRRGGVSHCSPVAESSRSARARKSAATSGCRSASSVIVSLRFRSATLSSACSDRVPAADSSPPSPPSLSWPSLLSSRQDRGGLRPHHLPRLIAEPVAVDVPADDAWSVVKADAGLVPQDRHRRIAEYGHLGNGLEHLVSQLPRRNGAEVVVLGHLRPVRGDEPVVVGMQRSGRDRVRRGQRP